MVWTHDWGHEDPHLRVIPCLVVFTVCIPNRAITGPGSELVDLHRLGLKLIRRRCIIKHLPSNDGGGKYEQTTVSEGNHHNYTLYGIQ